MLRRSGAALGLAAAWLTATAGPAAAHEAPDEGAEAVMADWMFLAFLVFFIAAVLVFVVVLRRGHLRNPESAKYHILTIDEPDYYTPDWARTAVQEPATHADDRRLSNGMGGAP